MKTILKRISAGVLAAVFLATFAVPRSRAVTGVDDTTLGIMATIVHLQSIGGELAVTQGTALATTDAVTALATQAGAAGALGAGVTGATALATIGAAVTAAAGGFTIGYIGYQTLEKLAEWIRQSKLTGTAENKIYQTGGSYNFLTDGTQLFLSRTDLSTNVVYSTQGGSSFWVNATRHESTSSADYDWVFISSRNVVKHFSVKDKPYSAWNFNNKQPYKMYDAFSHDTGDGYVQFYFPYMKSGYTSYQLPFDGAEQTGLWLDIFTPAPDVTSEKKEVTYAPPATWSPPAPALGQDVLYQPYPKQPDKSLTDIAQDVPKDIYDKQLKPLPPVVVTPETPPVTPPDIPPVNPNPDVETPEDVAPYTVKIGEVFPFCIPFDLYHMVTMFDSEPEAPHAKWEFKLPFTAGSYKIEWDLKEFDELAELCRKLELVLFCVGLAVVTSKLIKW